MSRDQKHIEISIIFFELSSIGSSVCFTTIPGDVTTPEHLPATFSTPEWLKQHIYMKINQVAVIYLDKISLGGVPHPLDDESGNCV